MPEKKKRVPSRATLEVRAYSRVARARDKKWRALAAQAKASDKHAALVKAASEELVNAEIAFADIAQPSAPGQQESPDA